MMMVEKLETILIERNQYNLCAALEEIVYPLGICAAMEATNRNHVLGSINAWWIYNRHEHRVSFSTWPPRR